jgi:hypothetical protein
MSEILSPEVTRYELGQLEVAFNQCLASEGLRFDPTIEFDRFAKRFVAQVRGFIAAGAPQHIPGYEVPANWWEHLKADLRTTWPRAFGRLRPKFITLQHPRTVYARVCPHIPIDPRDRSRCVVYVAEGLS